MRLEHSSGVGVGQPGDEQHVEVRAVRQLDLDSQPDADRGRVRGPPQLGQLVGAQVRQRGAEVGLGGDRREVGTELAEPAQSRAGVAPQGEDVRQGGPVGSGPAALVVVGHGLRRKPRTGGHDRDAAQQVCRAGPSHGRCERTEGRPADLGAEVAGGVRPALRHAVGLLTRRGQRRPGQGDGVGVHADPQVPRVARGLGAAVAGLEPHRQQHPDRVAVGERVEADAGGLVEVEHVVVGKVRRADERLTVTDASTVGGDHVEHALGRGW